MALHTKNNTKPLGDGCLCPQGSLEAELLRLCAGYRRSVAGRYAWATVETLGELGPGPFQVSPKIDGQLWFLIADGDELILGAPNGRVLCGELPLLDEARKTLGARASGRTVLAGELFVIPEGGRPRVGAVVSTLAGGKEAAVKRLCFQAFDLVEDGALEGEGAQEAYTDRLAALEAYLEGGKRVKSIATEQAADAGAIKEAFAKWVDGGKAEGLIARSPAGRIIKVKPEFTVDLGIVGYTQRSEEPDQVGSLLLAFMRADGSYQLAGSCGNLGSDEQRAAFYTQLSAQHADCNYRYASSQGAMYRFVEPTTVVEIRVNDLQSESISGEALTRMSLSYEGGWSALGKMPSVSLIHPVMVRVREDKQVNAVDIRISQVEERCFVSRLEDKAEPTELPRSTVLKREVYTKVSKGATTVKKLMLWKTNKEEQDDSFPAFVVHVTDYSPGRKDPIKRKVELAPTLDSAQALYADLLASNIKRGWNLVE
jgi:hypothetical protein